MKKKEKITVKIKVKIQADKLWELWTKPEHIIHWNFASEEWCSPKAENNLQSGGKFNYRMEAKDGSMGFDFWGIYDTVQENKLIEYSLGDGRTVKIEFIKSVNKTEIIETFEAENINPVEMQRDGWQSILDNFKKYAETIN